MSLKNHILMSHVSTPLSTHVPEHPCPQAPMSLSTHVPMDLRNMDLGTMFLGTHVHEHPCP